MRVRGAREHSAPRAVIANQNCWNFGMYSVGLTPDRDEGKSELFGNLSLVGSGGRFVAVLTKRQLTLERFDGHGIRLSLASISRMRHMKVPLFPSGAIPLGLLAIYLGASVLMPPYAMVAMVGGSLTLLGYVLSRTSVLAVETEAGDRHIISGSEGVLLRLCLMVDRVRHGSTIEEARMGLEHIDAELPAYPAFTDASGGLPEPKGLLGAPEEESILATVPEPEPEPLFTGFSAPPPPVPTAPTAADTEPIFPWESNVAADPVPIYESPPAPQEGGRSAYERAWGREESPPWYEEKAVGSRIDSALGEAAVGMDLFGEGGIFDAEPPASYSPPTTPQPMASHPAPEAGGYINAADPPAVESRQPTSSQMIRRAQNRFGETGPYTGPSLPAPTDSAIREECRPGVVKQARARQALLGSGEMHQSPVLDASSLEEFPGLSRIATSMNSGRVRAPRRKVSRRPGWISALLGATTPAIRNTDSTYASEYGDEDGQEARSESRFLSSQHIRLRSDQDHQADLAVRARQSPDNPPASAKDVMDRLVDRVSGGEDRAPIELTDQEGGLRFSQLRRTSSKGDPHPLPGIRRLE